MTERLGYSQNSHYPELRNNLRLCYIHQQPSGPTGETDCRFKHHNLAAAYNCNKNRGHLDRIETALEGLETNVQLKREIIHDDLVINGLVPPTRSSHALLANLRLGAPPLYRIAIKRRQSKNRLHNNVLAQENYFRNEIYLLIRRAIQVYRLYTVPPPHDLSPDEFEALLPIDQVSPFQAKLDKLIERTMAQTNNYNEINNKLGPEEDAVTDLVSYSLRPYSPNEEPTNRTAGNPMS